MSSQSENVTTAQKVADERYIGGRVPTSLYDRFREVAKDEDRSVSAELRRALERWVDPEAVRDRNGGR